MKLVIATTNPGKLREIEGILSGIPFTLETLKDYPPVAEPAETGQTFGENARLKALYYAAATGELTVADDSGSKSTRSIARQASIPRGGTAPTTR